MSQDILKKIEHYLEKHNHLNLGTVSRENLPMVHTVAYASEGATVYFVTNKASRKAQNFVANPAVAYTVDEDEAGDWSKIQGIQAMGNAMIIENADETQQVMAKMIKKFPQMANLPPDPNMVFVKVVPTETYFIDNSVSFGHRDRMEF